MKIEPLVLEGRVARLEPLEQKHAAALAQAATPELFTYHFPPAELTPGGFAPWIEFLRRQPGFCPFAIVDRKTGQAIGVTCYLDIRPQDRGVEIGFTWLGRTFHGSPVNPECKYLLLRNAFDAGAVRVQLKTDLRNVQSQRAIEKLGATREGVLRQHMIRPDGYIRDTVMYSVIASQWPEVRERLEARLGYIP